MCEAGSSLAQLTHVVPIVRVGAERSGVSGRFSGCPAGRGSELGVRFPSFPQVSFFCSVLPPRQIISMFLKGLELQLGIYGESYECGILAHSAALSLILRLCRSPVILAAGASVVGQLVSCSGGL
jgi:hypothetical protein